MTKKQWQERILSLDDDYCVNSGTLGCSHYAASAHHIIYRSGGGPDDDWNGISLCSNCHHKAHNGGIHQDAGGRVSGRVFMYLTLMKLKDKKNFRWGKALAELEKTLEVQRWKNEHNK